LLAAAAAVTFYAISIDHELYAPGATTVARHLPFAGELNAWFILRKTYSIVAFAIVGFFAASMFAPGRRALRCAALVGTFSLTIEVGQKLTGTRESLFSNAFDVGCGAAGGLLGALLWDASERFRRGLRRAP
jgi:hypothetical protein